MRTELNIEGMHCEKCAARLQKALAARNGVADAQVDFSTKCATLVFDDAVITLDELKSAVADCGFSVVNS